MIFGLLILIHELGHYLFARLFHVKINEFSIGMGPKLLSKTAKKTGIRYSLRLLPIGGYVAMEGENGPEEEMPAVAEGPLPPSEDGERAEEPSAKVSPTLPSEMAEADASAAAELSPAVEPFYKKPVWQRILITAAGAVMNLLLGALLMTLFAALTPRFGGTQVADFTEISFFEGSSGDVSEETRPDYSTADGGLQKNDVIEKIDGSRVYSANDLVYEVFNLTPGESVEVIVRRNGERITLPAVNFPTQTLEGKSYCTVDFQVYAIEKNFLSTCRMAFSQTRLSVKMVWESLLGLLTGRYGVKDMSGPVGVTEAIGEAAKEDIAAEQSDHQLLYLCAIITVNLGIFNLLPIPALDGGRLLFQLIELIFRRPVPAKFEALVHLAGIVLLLGLMVLITYKDIVNLFT